MRFKMTLTLASSLMFLGCASKGTNPDDPYESMNRKTHAFNMAFDATVLKPLAKGYKAVLPAPIRTGINNAYDNVNGLPTIANDLLQAEGNYAIKDSWRFIVNSTLGVAGIFDVASKFSLPPHSNDMGLTFAKWGDKKSPYFVIPLLGPSTFRDGMGLMFNYALFTPYPYIRSNPVLYSLLGLRYVDLRSQMLDTDKLLDEGLDKYTFIREAYLQHRQYLLTGEAPAENEDKDNLYVDEIDENPAPSSQFPITTS